MLLARVADSLYWMGRYLERAEHVSRALAIRLEDMVEQGDSDVAEAWARLASVLGQPSEAAQADPVSFAFAQTFEKANPSSVMNCVRLARDNARQIREQISTEIWFTLNTQFLRLQALTEAEWRVAPSAQSRATVDALVMIAGLIDSTMRHGEGWHFLTLGRHIERAQLVARMLQAHFAGPATLPEPDHGDWITLLKTHVAFEPYCKVYTATLHPRRIGEFLIFDGMFPHSLRFAVDRIYDELQHAGPGMPQGRRQACLRHAGRLRASLDYGQVDELLAGDAGLFFADVQKRCAEIHRAVSDTFFAYGIEEMIGR